MPRGRLEDELQATASELTAPAPLQQPPPSLLDTPSLYYHCGRQVAGGRHFRFLGLATVVISAYTCPTFGHIAALHSLQEAPELGPHFSMTFHSWAAAIPPPPHVVSWKYLWPCFMAEKSELKLLLFCSQKPLECWQPFQKFSSGMRIRSQEVYQKRHGGSERMEERKRERIDVLWESSFDCCTGSSCSHIILSTRERIYIVHGRFFKFLIIFIHS